MMPFSSSPGVGPGLTENVQQFFSFQMIVAPNSKFKVLPVTNIDKELSMNAPHELTNKPDFVVV